MLTLTPTQQDIHLEGRIFGDAVNHIGGYQKYFVAVDLARFAKARERLLTENDAYRLRFATDVEACVPYIDAAPADGLALHDFSTSKQPEASALAWIQERFESPMGSLGETTFDDAMIRIGNSEYWYFARAHHLVMDGSGLAEQMRRILEGYRDTVSDVGEKGATAPSFVAYMEKQAPYVGSAAFETARTYWRARLADEAERLFTPNPQAGTAPRSGRVSFVLESSLKGQLEAVARSVDGHISALMQAAIATYLTRSFQIPSVTIGTPVHNRRGAAERALIGSLVNVTAAPISAPRETPFQELVRQVAAGQRRDLRHGRFPIGALRHLFREMGRPVDTGVYEVAFNYQKLDFNFTMDGKAVETHFLSHHRERVPLSVVMCDYGAGQDVIVHLDYSLRYLDENEALGISSRLAHILQQVATEPERCVGDVEVLTPAEWQQQHVQWNAGARIDARGGCLHDRMVAHALSHPALPAVVHDDTVMSYGELDREASRLANRLRRNGIGKGDFVAVCHARTPGLIVALFAVLKVGAAYAPLDPAYPKARNAYILEDTAARCAIVDEAGAQALDGLLVTLLDPLVAHDTVPSIQEYGTSEKYDVASAGDLAYVIYTSGSTGRPKGVLIEHRNALALIDWALATWTEVELARVLAATSICFDLSVFEIFAPLSSGGAIVLVDNALALHDRPSIDVTLVNTVPSAISALLDSQAIPPSTRCVNLAGEPLRQDLVERIHGGRSVRVFDLYGPSEDTTYSTFAPRIPGGRETIGKPIAGSSAYVLDNSGNPLPPGAKGELYLGGHGVARGYLNQAGMTAERFVHSAHAGERLYRTGDLVRYFDDGSLQYLGRLDGQVKVRGFRIELGEIEVALRALPQVVDCAVTAHDAAVVEGGISIVACIVLAREADGTDEPDIIGQLRDGLSRLLPSHMIPAHFSLLDALPLNANGKVDRHQLPGPTGGKDSVNLAPRTDTERRLQRIWEASTGVVAPGVLQSYFSVGGDSLRLLRMAHAIEREFGVNIELPLLFTVTTIAGQATEIGRRRELSELIASVTQATVVGGHHIDL